jgi:hypothetical protein
MRQKLFALPFACLLLLGFAAHRAEACEGTNCAPTVPVTCILAAASPASAATGVPVPTPKLANGVCNDWDCCVQMTDCHFNYECGGGSICLSTGGCLCAY